MTADTAPLRVLLVDDEAFARARLRDLLADCRDPPARAVGEAATAAEATAWLAEQACDLVLLDIQMPGADGLQFAARLKRLPAPPAVVFVTAHAEHALAAFDLEATDYLTKPVRRERLEAALRRVAQRIGTPTPTPIATTGNEALVHAADVDAIIVSDRGGVLRVPVGEVLYFKAELKYVTLRTGERSHLLDDTLAELEARFPERFLRIHRNALVAREAMRALARRPLAAQPTDGSRDDDPTDGWAVQVAGVDEWLAVSRRQVAAVREALIGRLR